MFDDRANANADRGSSSAHRARTLRAGGVRPSFGRGVRTAAFLSLFGLANAHAKGYPKRGLFLFPLFALRSFSKVEARDRFAMEERRVVDEETLTSFDELERLESLPRSAPSGRVEGGGLGPREQSVESFDGSSLSGDGSPIHANGTSSTPMLRSVLTRKPSMAALKLMQEGGTGEGESVDEAEDDGVCSLSEFAMVLNAAAWVSALCDASDSRSRRFNFFVWFEHLLKRVLTGFSFSLRRRIRMRAALSGWKSSLRSSNF